MCFLSHPLLPLPNVFAARSVRPSLGNDPNSVDAVTRCYTIMTNRLAVRGRPGLGRRFVILHLLGNRFENLRSYFHVWSESASDLSSCLHRQQLTYKTFLRSLNAWECKPVMRLDIDNSGILVSWMLFPPQFLKVRPAFLRVILQDPGLKTCSRSPT